jgi:hypothetical protein
VSAWHLDSERHHDRNDSGLFEAWFNTEFFTWWPTRLIGLCEQGHEVHVAYRTSGNRAVLDETADARVDFGEAFCRAFGVGTKNGEITEKNRGFLRDQAAGDVDVPEPQ